jgi:hypothetical protein
MPAGPLEPNWFNLCAGHQIIWSGGSSFPLQSRAISLIQPKSPATRAGLIGNIFQDRQSARLTVWGPLSMRQSGHRRHKTTVPARMSGRCLSRHARAQRPRFRVRQPFTGIIFPELLRRTTKARQFNRRALMWGQRFQIPADAFAPDQIRLGVALW